MGKAKTVTCSVFGKDNTEKVYEGRFICMMDDEQFNSLVRNPKMAKKLYTMESLPVALLADDVAAAEGKRLVMVVNKQDDTTLIRKKLFVSEKIGLLSHFNLRKKEVGISCDSSWISIEEE